jgi:hypothetical protein
MRIYAEEKAKARTKAKAEAQAQQRASGAETTQEPTKARPADPEWWASTQTMAHKDTVDRNKKQTPKGQPTTDRKPKQELENKVQKFKREQARKQDEQKETIAELTRRIKELEQEQAWEATGKQRQADKDGQDRKDARIAKLEKEKEQDRERIAELEKEVEQERGEKEEMTRIVNELMSSEDETKEMEEKDATN